MFILWIITWSMFRAMIIVIWSGIGNQSSCLFHFVWMLLGSMNLSLLFQLLVNSKAASLGSQALVRQPVLEMKTSEFKPAVPHLKINLVSIFTNPSARAGYDTRSIFKWSLTGLNSVFPSRLVASPRLKNSVCPAIYL